jgi:hypothetical protein
MDAASQVARVVRNPVVVSQVAAKKAAAKKAVAVVARKVAVVGGQVVAIVSSIDNLGELNELAPVFITLVRIRTCLA